MSKGVGVKTTKITKLNQVWGDILGGVTAIYVDVNQWVLTSDWKIFKIMVTRVSFS